MNATTKIALLHFAALLIPVLTQVLGAIPSPWTLLASQVLALLGSALISHNDLTSQKIAAPAPAPAPTMPALSVPAPLDTAFTKK